MDKQFQDSLYCIEYAEKMLLQLKNDIGIFERTSPYNYVVKSAGETDTHLVTPKKRISTNISGHTETIINKLRSSLDRAIYNIKKSKKSKFPYTENPDKLTSFFQENAWAKEIPQGIQEIIARHKPYKSGNRRLWALSRLDNIAKHRTQIGMKLSSPGIRVHELKGSFHSLRIPPLWNNDLNAIELFSCPKGSLEKINIEISIELRIQIPETEDSLSLISLLSENIFTVKNIISDFKAYYISKS
jgi:hypothetical protein